LAGTAFILLLVLVWVQAPKSVEYETIEIPVPEGFFIEELLQINDAGVVAGQMRNTTDLYDHLFVWDRDHGLRDLGIPPFVSRPYWIWIADINNRGQLIGVFGPIPDEEEEGTVHSYLCRSFFYDPQDGFREIGALKGHWNPDVRSLNDRGQVVGYCEHLMPDEKRVFRLFVWDPETGIRDPNLTGWVGNINERGQVLVKDAEGSAFSIWSPDGDLYRLERSDYGPMTWGYLDDTGGIVGWISDSAPSNAFRIFQWDRQQGYHFLARISEQNDDRSNSIIEINDRKFLFYQQKKPFDWFGLVGWNYYSGIQLRIYSVGEDVTIVKGIYPIRYPDSRSWSINRNGWMVRAEDQKAYVMIPKGKAGKKKD